MNIQAIYENGRLTLPADIRLKRQRVQIRLDIPDDALAPQTHLVQSAFEAGDIRECIQTILGSDRDRLTEASVSTDSDQAIWHRHLGEKHLACD